MTELLKHFVHYFIMQLKKGESGAISDLSSLQTWKVWELLLEQDCRLNSTHFCPIFMGFFKIIWDVLKFKFKKFHSEIFQSPPEFCFLTKKWNVLWSSPDRLVNFYCFLYYIDNQHKYFNNLSKNFVYDTIYLICTHYF